MWDPERNICCGNPATAPEVRAVVDAAKTRDSELGQRSHSAAMSREYMKKIMKWSEKECPGSLITNTLLKPSQASQTELSKVLKHSFMRAFLTTGWTLWTRCVELSNGVLKCFNDLNRNFELVKLQRKHYSFNIETRDEAGYLWHHDVCELKNRKGWQHKISKEVDLAGALQAVAGVYKI
ncbi:MAG TPA: hypothetical protein VGO47_13670 [Chlamydiales bacterium]|jgi:hypothetical protein|nr:hypothetical protein [Chlamydiales bacterium]